MVRYHYVLVFFDSGASPCLIWDGFSASHSILVFMDTSREIKYNKWSSHHLYNQTDRIIPDSRLLPDRVMETALGTRFGYYDFLIVFSEPPTPGSLYMFGGPLAPLASLSEGCVLVIRGPNQVWASLRPGA